MLFPALRTLPVSTVPATLRLASVPTVVKLDVRTPEFRVLPVRSPAGAVMLAEPAAVS